VQQEISQVHAVLVSADQIAQVLATRDRAGDPCCRWMRTDAMVSLRARNDGARMESPGRRCPRAKSYVFL